MDCVSLACLCLSSVVKAFLQTLPCPSVSCLANVFLFIVLLCLLAVMGRLDLCVFLVGTLSCLNSTDIFQLCCNSAKWPEPNPEPIPANHGVRGGVRHWTGHHQTFAGQLIIVTAKFEHSPKALLTVTFDFLLPNSYQFFHESIYK